MNIEKLQEVMTTLETVIANKEALLIRLQDSSNVTERMVAASFLELNLTDLKNIRDHLKEVF